nr:immunoglobulin light chain junction region [Macaca mulatta]
DYYCGSWDNSDKHYLF